MISLHQKIRNQMYAEYLCRNDQYLTFESEMDVLEGLLGYPADEFRLLFQNRFLELVEESAREELLSKLAEQLEEGDDIELILPFYHKSGSVIWLLNRGSRIIDEGGQEYFAGVLVDVTRSQQQYLDQKKLWELYQIVLSQTETEKIIFEWDCINDRISFSDAWEKIFGYKPKTEHMSELLRNSKHFYPNEGEHIEKHFLAMQEGEHYQILETRIQRSDGNYLWCRIRATGVYDEQGTLCKIAGVIVDIDAEKKEVSALRKRAELDSLTKIYNAQTTRKLTEAYLKERTTGMNGAVLIVDLDDFKQVNDRFGHMYGDEVLVQSAQIIRKLFRSQDIVGRIGGEEFLVLMKEVADLRIVYRRCSQLVESFHQIFDGEKFYSKLTCSIGVAFAPAHGTEYETLFQRADQALYQAKRNGKDQFVFFENEK